MVTMPTKFQVDMNLNTNMTSDDLWMTSDDHANTGKKINNELEIIPTKFQIHTKLYTNMTLDGPYMTLDDP